MTQDNCQSLSVLLYHATFPALKTLHLRGWFDETSVTIVAATSIFEGFSRYDLVGLGALLFFLPSTTVTRLELSNSTGHPDEDECVFERAEGANAFGRRGVRYL